jgi:hypothetical protein
MENDNPSQNVSSTEMIYKVMSGALRYPELIYRLQNQRKRLCEFI